MSLFNVEYTNTKIPNQLTPRILNYKTLMETAKNINHTTGTVNDLKFNYQQNLLNNFNKYQNINQPRDLLQNHKTTIDLLNIVDGSKNITKNITQLYNLTVDSNLDKYLDELFKGINNAKRAIKNIYQHIF